MLSCCDVSEGDLQTEFDVLAQKIRELIPPGHKISFVSGNFNVVHTGHLRLLSFASECSDYLIVGVQNDASIGALIDEALRLEAIQSIQCVDFAFILPGAAEKFITCLQPDVVVKGKEHELHFNPEQASVENYGGKLLFSSGETHFSSLDLLKYEFQDIVLTTIKKPRDYFKRHSINMSQLRGVVERFSDLSVVVLGDLIIDEYISCDPLGLSREDPTIVVTPVKRDIFVGAAGIVAAHARGLGAKVQYFSVVGQDEAAIFGADKLSEYEVETCLITDTSRPTSLKQRFRAQGKTLFRISHLRHHDIDSALADEMLERLTDAILKADIVIFSDFNYGCLSPYLVDRVVALCNKHGVPMVADSQSSSQLGDVSRFHGMLLMTPTEYEARIALRDQTSGLTSLAEHLRQKTHARHLFVTLGPDGLLVHSPGSEKNGIVTDQLPALNSAPKDVVGCGDSLLVCASLALATGADIWQSAYLGSLAAAFHAGREGNIPLAKEDLLQELSL